MVDTRWRDFCRLEIVSFCRQCLRPVQAVAHSRLSLRERSVPLGSLPQNVSQRINDGPIDCSSTQRADHQYEAASSRMRATCFGQRNLDEMVCFIEIESTLLSRSERRLWMVSTQRRKDAKTRRRKDAKSGCE